MRCERAARAIVRGQLGTLRARGARRLTDHLDRCERCAAAATREAEITAALRAWPAEYPFPIDVAPRVMAELSRGVARVSDTPDRPVAWGSIAAALSAVALLAAGLDFLPLLPKALDLAGTLLRGAWVAAAGLGRPLLELVSTPLRLLLSVDLLKPLVATVLPAAASVTLAACALMSATVAVVVGRELAGIRARGTGGLLA